MKKQINVPLLRKIQQAIIAEPKFYDQNCLIDKADKNGIVVYHKDYTGQSCGTKCCIAGWAVKLSVPDSTFERYVSGQYKALKKARKLIGLTPKQSKVLFDTIEDCGLGSIESLWPIKHAKAYARAKTPAVRARAGYRMIEDFIKENA